MPPVLICLTLVVFLLPLDIFICSLQHFLLFFLFFCHLKHLHLAEVLLWLIHVDTLMMNVPNFKSKKVSIWMMKGNLAAGFLPWWNWYECLVQNQN